MKLHRKDIFDLNMAQETFFRSIHYLKITSMRHYRYILRKRLFFATFALIRNRGLRHGHEFKLGQTLRACPVISAPQITFKAAR